MHYDVTTKPDDIITSGEDANCRIGDEIFILFIGNEQDFAVLGCNTIHDIGFYAAKHDFLQNIEGSDDQNSWILIRARILDPENLPYEIEYGDCVYVIFDDEVLFRGEDMASATNHIEGMFKLWDIEIDDFAIVTGCELPLGAKNRLLDKIEMFNDLKKEGLLDLDNEALSSGQC